jgi:IS30 family transposase
MLQWSPEEIANWLRRRYPHDENRRVSHETIYKTLFIQARGALKKELLAHLRLSKAMRHPRGHTQKNRQIKNAVSIRERPAEAEDRAVPGHWEGDLLIGANNSQIATLVERLSRYCPLVRVKSRHTETVIDAPIKQAQKLAQELYKSLTRDRGKEMADHQRFSLATDIKVYFCDPQSPWQRGSNEQINGLLRQYFPKGMGLLAVHQNRLNAVARRLDERPRKTLGYYSPAEKFAECVASTI